MTKYVIYLAGDSTVENVPPEQGNKQGWGQPFSSFFTDEVCVINEAKGGRSSKSFIVENRLCHILKDIKKGNYLFIQFGHNDQKTDDKLRGTKPYSTYQLYLTEYVTRAREKEAIPILITPVNRREMEMDRQKENSLEVYSDAMRQIASSLNVPLIDLWQKSKSYYEQLGEEDTKTLFAWYELENTEIPRDDTHFGSYGAKKIAELVIEGMQELELEPVSCLK